MAEADLSPVQIEAPASAATEAASAAGPIRFNVLAPRPRCPDAPAGEIVVCATDNEQFRLRPLPDKYEPDRGPLQLKLGENAAAGAELEGASIGGWVTNRVMARVKLKF